jgi:hypothetical protein
MDTFGPIDKGIVKRNNVFDEARLYHLDTYAANRAEGFPKSISRRASRMDLPSTTRHENEAMAIANPKPTLGQKLTKGMQFLGLTE